MADYYKGRRLNYQRRIVDIGVDSDQRSGLEQRDFLRYQEVMIAKLKKTSMFKSMSDPEFKAILAIASKKTFSKGTVVFREGDDSNDMFILLEGVLQISLGGKDLTLVTPIGFAGEMGVISDETRSATVTAKSDCVMMELNKNELNNIFNHDHELRKNFYRGVMIDLSTKIKVMNEIIVKIRDMRNT